MGGESPEDEIGRKAALIYPTFWSLFLRPMYDHVSFASKVLRTLTAKAPFSSPEPVVSWSRGLGSLQIRPSGSVDENTKARQGEKLDWSRSETGQNTVNFLLSPLGCFLNSTTFDGKGAL